jgi:DNA-binding NarL/FixJ family response regulator
VHLAAEVDGDPSPSRPLRLVIADDDYLVREALTRILTDVTSMEVVRSCQDRDSLLEAVRDQRPDAILTEIRMPPTRTDEGIQVARALRRTDPDVGVVVLSHFADPSYVLELLESGSAGRAYLLKQRVSDPRQLVAAVEAVVAGESLIDAVVVDALVRSRTHGARSQLSQLTAREHDVLAEIAQGKSNGAIARSLVLTKRAVEKHVNAIFMKLDLRTSEDVSRRVMATLIFLADGRPSAETLERR